jgi:hypothetical protein
MPYLSLPTALVAIALSPWTPSLSTAASSAPTTAMARKKVTGDDLSARGKENGYQRGLHRDKDNLREQNKHVDEVKKDQMQRWIVTSCMEALFSKTMNTDPRFQLAP